MGLRRTASCIDRLPIHYNIGHIMAMHGDTVKPRGKYVVALNKLAIDRFNPVGPLHPQNHQLDRHRRATRCSCSTTCRSRSASRTTWWRSTRRCSKPIVRYPTGTNSRTGRDLAVQDAGRARSRSTRNGNKVEVFGTEIRSHITPEIIEVDEGDEVVDPPHQPGARRGPDPRLHGQQVQRERLARARARRRASRSSADTPGVFPYYCTEFCSALHLEMEGYLLVKPKGYKPACS